MSTVITTASMIADVLREAANAHHEYERTHGTDPNWADWYAAYITRVFDLTLIRRPDPVLDRIDPDYPIGMSYYDWRHAGTDPLDLATSDMTIPDASAKFDRLVAFADRSGFSVVSWDMAVRELDTPAKPIGAANGLSWIRDGSRHIAIRPGFSPSVTLYLMIHEMGHSLGRVAREVDPMLGHPWREIIRKNFCWFDAGLAWINPMKAVHAAGEIEAESITRAVLAHYGVPTTTSDAYLEGYQASLFLLSQDDITKCLPIAQTAQQIITAMDGTEVRNASKL